MTTTPFATTRGVLDTLEARLAAMLDPLDIPRSWTPRQLDTYERERQLLAGRIQNIRLDSAAIAELTPQIATLTTWRDYQVSWREQLSTELLAIHTDTTDPAERGRQNHLRLSIKRIDQGLDFMRDMLPARLPLDDLMAAAGYVPRDLVARAQGEAWLGSLPEVERRLAELTRRRDDAQRRLDDALREIERIGASS